MKETTMNFATKKPTPTVRKIARIEDKATGQFLDQIEFQVGPTDKRRLDLLPSIVGDPTKFENSLLDHGAVLPPEGEERKVLLSEVAQSEAPDRFVYEAQGGWLDPGNVFVLPDGAISTEDTNIVGISQAHTVADPSGRRSKRGSLISWRDSVGQLARLSSLLMLTTSAALAAPLLAITGSQSFGFNIYGKTRSGKTLATLLGSSVIGIGRVENLINWNITDARLEQRLAEFNDLPFPIDDFSAMPGGDKQKYLRIREVTYKVSQGWSKGRHSSFTNANEGVHAGWRCILLTSSEKSIRHLAEKANVQRQGGELLRLIDIPAIFDGSDHIFDRMVPTASTSDINSWKKATFVNIVADCQANHGAAVDAYIEKIITADFDVKQFVQDNVAFFVQHVSETADGDVTRDVAGKFGLVYAGGMLGIRLGVVPWDRADLLDAIAKCFRSARDILSDEGVVLRHGISVLQARLLNLVRVKKLSPEERASIDWDTIDGYLRRSNGQDRFVIKREVFNSLFATTGQKDLVLQWLTDEGHIVMAFVEASSSAMLRKPKGQFFWPDGERRRSYEIVFPRS
jgi:hypothetical protein